jgi:hypothetical protein
MAASIRREFGALVAVIEGQRLGRALRKNADLCNGFLEFASVAGVIGQQAQHTMKFS